MWPGEPGRAGGGDRGVGCAGSSGGDATGRARASARGIETENRPCGRDPRGGGWAEGVKSRNSVSTFFIGW